jgi:hypothetical protein
MTRPLRGRLDAMLRKTLWLAMVSATLIGCAAGEPYQPLPVSSSKSVIYIYRPSGLLQSTKSQMVTCGHESIEIDSGGYYSFFENSGPVSCSAGENPLVQFEAHPGEEYFIKEVVAPIYSGSKTQLTLVRASIARDEIALCRMQGIAANTSSR